MLLFELAACTIGRAVGAVNRRVLCFQASDDFGLEAVDSELAKHHISSLMMTEDSVVLLSIYAHSEQSDLGIIPVRILLLDTDVVFSEVDLGHGHSLFSFYLRSILLLALNKHAV